MVPVVLYLSERLIRAFRSGIEAVSILKVESNYKHFYIEI